MQTPPILTAVLLLAAVSAAAQQQAPQLMGTISTHDAQVNGGLEVQGEQARLLANASVTAYNHTAAVNLARGGQALVCSTSEFHLLHAGVGSALVFGLDRGALELHTQADSHDVILTPDIRFAIETPLDHRPESYDLRLRVTRNGDTCVDNSGSTAPVLLLSGTFGDASYRLTPGQHVLFEHGNLHEVVDHEHSSCGCPQPPPPGSVAAAHPFPEAASEGLAPEQPPQNSTQPGEKNTQVSTTFIYGEGHGAPPSTIDPTASSSAGSASASQPEQPHGFFRAIGHFFHKLFHAQQLDAVPTSRPWRSLVVLPDVRSFCSLLLNL